MSAALVTVNYDSSRLLTDNRILAAAADLGVAVVVADNFSSDAERARIRDLCLDRGWALVALAQNKGFGGGVNAAIGRAVSEGCDRVVLLNPDADMKPDTLEALIEATRDDPGALIAPSVRREDGSVWFEVAELDLNNGQSVLRPGDERADVPNAWLTGACLAMDVGVWQSVRGFDDRYFMYWEDIDFSFSVREAGMRLVSRPDLTVLHLVGGTQDSRALGRSALYYRYNCRGRLVFAAKHLPRATMWRWVFSSPSYGFAVLRRGVRRRDLPRLGPRRIWSAVRGTVEGVWVCCQPASSSRNSRDHLRSPAPSSAAANTKNTA